MKKVGIISVYFQSTLFEKKTIDKLFQCIEQELLKFYLQKALLIFMIKFTGSSFSHHTNIHTQIYLYVLGLYV